MDAAQPLLRSPHMGAFAAKRRKNRGTAASQPFSTAPQALLNCAAGTSQPFLTTAPPPLNRAAGASQLSSTLVMLPSFSVSSPESMRVATASSRARSVCLLRRA